MSTVASCWVAAAAAGCLGASLLPARAFALMDLIASETDAGLAFGSALETAAAGFLEDDLDDGAGGFFEVVLTADAGGFLAEGAGFTTFVAAGLALFGAGLATDLGASWAAFFTTGVGFLAVGFAFTGVFLSVAALALAGAGFEDLGGVFTGFAGAFALGGVAAFLAELEDFVLFCGLVALRGEVFEEVDFVFKLLSFRPVQRAVEHQPRGFLGQEFVFGFFAVPGMSMRGSRPPP